MRACRIEKMLAAAEAYFEIDCRGRQRKQRREVVRRRR
jgi:hypothetical protein